MFIFGQRVDGKIGILVNEGGITSLETPRASVCAVGGIGDHSILSVEFGNRTALVYADSLCYETVDWDPAGDGGKIYEFYVH